MTSIRKWMKQYGVQAAASFVLPVGLLMIAYAFVGVYWGSERSVLASDAFNQFANFHGSFRRVLTGENSLFYLWDTSLGLNYWALISYYLGGIFTPLVLFFPMGQMAQAIYVLTLLKVGCAGLAFAVYASHTFRINRWYIPALSSAYALMSFVGALTEIIMWLDTFVWLPLIILGINRVMEKGKPWLLFIAYFAMFVTNFYMGFIVGVFSFLYFLARLVVVSTHRKQAAIAYLSTALLSGLASFIMILPTVLDLVNNGEKTDQVLRIKTQATGWLDLLMKNMVGVFDTTKYGSIPFIYIGLIPLIFCLFYFVTPVIPWKHKVAYGLIFGVLIASFYLEPLNLFWHGFHAPNMFLFRYSFVFSFLVIMLAGYGLEAYDPLERGRLISIVLSLLILFSIGKFLIHEGFYDYILNLSFFVTVGFLLVYLFVVFVSDSLEKTGVVLCLAVVMIAETGVNTLAMQQGISADWGYVSHELYSGGYSNYAKAVDKAEKLSDGTFFRFENLDQQSQNESFLYGYSSISYFSSIRNRNASRVLKKLGYTSHGTNLKALYLNNLLIPDALFDVKYNLVKENRTLGKYGFDEVYHDSQFRLYENEAALSLGMMVDRSVLDVPFTSDDPLVNQTMLLNQLTGKEETYYQAVQPELLSLDNSTVQSKERMVTFTADDVDEPQVLRWKAEIPAHQQAYMMLLPYDVNGLEKYKSTVTLKKDGEEVRTRIMSVGQFYNLGYTEEKKETITFETELAGKKEMSFFPPTIVLLDTQAFQSAIDQLKKQEADLTVGKRSVKGTVRAEKDHQLLFTTMAYDKGWQAKVDGKRVAIEPFEEGLITIPIPKGQHTVEFVFFPYGLKVGIGCFVLGVSLFIFLWYRKIGVAWSVVEEKEQEGEKADEELGSED